MPPVGWMAMHEDQQDAITLGPNAWLVDEMYDQFREDPNSVSESWREFFADYHHRGAATVLADGRRCHPGRPEGGAGAGISGHRLPGDNCRRPAR